jgi:nicotinate-nucleotide adenylyltransferase
MIVSDLEIRRGGISYTWETVDAVRKLTGVRPFLLIGGDNLAEIKTWKSPDRILELAQVTAVTRPGFDFLEKFPQYQGRILPLPMAPADVSSTGVRDRLKRGEDVSGLVPAPALKIILERGFYR